MGWCLLRHHRHLSMTMNGWTSRQRTFQTSFFVGRSVTREETTLSRGFGDDDTVVDHHDSPWKQSVVLDRHGIPEEMKDMVETYLRQSPTRYSLQQLMRTGQEEPTGHHHHHHHHHHHPTTSPSLLPFRGRLGRRLAAERVLMQYASMLRRELPIRLAHRIHDLDGIPGLRDMPAVRDVRTLYLESLVAVVATPEPTKDRRSEARFATLLDGLYRRHATVLLRMAQGAHEFRRSPQRGPSAGGGSSNRQWQFSQHDQCQIFLDRFYSSRVGIRVLAGQYLALREQLLGKGPVVGSREDYVGMICKRTSPHRVVQAAVQDASRLCREEYGGVAPTVTISGRLDLTFCYIPTHLHYIIMELLKNAMRATMDFHIQKYSRDHEEGHAVTHRESVESLQSPLSNYRRIRQASAEAAHDSRGLMVVPDVDKIPPVTVIIADSPKNEDVIIKVMDEGGGIPRSKLNTIWSYLYTTAENSVQERVLLQRKDDKGDRESVETTDVASAAAALSKSPILAGLGFGLPMSRAYARYFGGDLDIISLEGYGTDAYVYLRRLEETTSHSNEI